MLTEWTWFLLKTGHHDQTSTVTPINLITFVKRLEDKEFYLILRLIRYQGWESLTNLSRILATTKVYRHSKDRGQCQCLEKRTRRSVTHVWSKIEFSLCLWLSQIYTHTEGKKGRELLYTIFPPSLCLHFRMPLSPRN